MAFDKSKIKKVYLWIGIIFLSLIILGGISGLIVKYIWLGNLGYDQIFWKIKWTQFLLFFIGLLIALLFMGLNIHFISKRLRPIHLNLGESPNGEMNVKRINTKNIKIILYVVAFLFSLFFAFNWSYHWDTYLRFANAQPFPTTDPIFGLNTSFYVFTLPFLEFVQNSITGLVFFTTAVIIVYYLLNGDITLPKSKHEPKLMDHSRSYKQIYTNAGIWFLLLGIGYFLDRYHLLFKHNNLIDGANYTDVHVLIPVFWILAIGCILVGGFAFYQNRKSNVKRFLFSIVGLILIGIIGGLIVPSLVQNFKVDPSELSVEKPYIKHNIAFTRKAYHLDSVQVKKYEAKDTLTYAEIRSHKEATQNIRIWDQNLTVQTYKQLQEIRSYYQFYNIDLDRYHTKKGYRQVLISARELSEKLPPKAQTWVNKRLQYTHGFGIVMSPTTQKTEEGNPIFYIKDIPPRSDIGLKVDQPSIYYGESQSGYKLVNTKIGELDYPKGSKNVYSHYDGKGGVLIDNYFKRLLFAWEFGDFNILMTDYLKKDSRIQFWRSIQNRVSKIVPFLKLDQDPYIVLNKGKLYWIQDAYTTASQYPYAEPYKRGKNYIRNAVKVVVNAYDGTVNFYISNANDPVIKTYQKAFPGVFKPLSEMPKTLKEHLKYPKDLFKIQLEKFSTFHMTNPQVFYNQEDLWTRPNESYGGKQVEVQPYYLLGTLPESKHPKDLQYLLISPMVPKGRDNMISWMVVKSDGARYGQIVNYELPKERLLLGPAQIEAKINQNTEISRQLSLWDQRGSRVIRGDLMVIPIDNSFLYVEPVFLFSTNVNIPQLKRVIATTGSNVVMRPTLNEAIRALYHKEGSASADTAIQVTPKGDTLTTILPNSIQKIQASKLKKVQKLWKEMEKSMGKGDWKDFGEKMDSIHKTLNKSE